MKRERRIAGVVVLYRPGLDVLGHIRSYIDQVEALYLIDNSENPSPEIVRRLESLPKVTYVANGENVGVARALNMGAARAGEEGFDLLLTMDQDSVAAPEMIEYMLQCLEVVGPEKMGMMAPFHLTAAGKVPPGELCTDVMTPMTSGCLLDLAAYRASGPFWDELFIDFVDNEYCLRLRKNGFRVLRANRALLQHSVGNTVKYGPFVATHHSPLRRYYKTRNRLYVFSRYYRHFTRHCLFDLVRLAKEIVSILLFEQGKAEKYLMMFKGCRDFLHGKMGQYRP